MEQVIRIGKGRKEFTCFTVNLPFLRVIVFGFDSESTAILGDSRTSTLIRGFSIT